MGISIPPNAPRFHTLWQHIEKKKRIFVIRKSDWNSLNISDATDEKLVKLSLQQFQPLPISDIMIDNDVIGGTVFATASKVIIKIYRRDPKDEPTPINVDTYTVWMSLPTYLNVPEMIETGSTDYDDNFKLYANDHVFLVKENPSDDHWLEDLPREVYALLSNE